MSNLIDAFCEQLQKRTENCTEDHEISISIADLQYILQDRVRMQTKIAHLEQRLTAAIEEQRGQATTPKEEVDQLENPCRHLNVFSFGGWKYTCRDCSQKWYGKDPRKLPNAPDCY